MSKDSEKQVQLPASVLGAVLGVVRNDLLQRDPAQMVAIPDDVRQWLSDLLAEGESSDFARNELKGV